MAQLELPMKRRSLGEMTAGTSDKEYRSKMRIRVQGCSGGIGNGARTMVLCAMTAINHVFFAGAARGHAV